ncbi:hypothetical protein [Sphingobacterium paludis]|nr:hypothetical protein [Sphingobacterium paludis]
MIRTLLLLTTIIGFISCSKNEDPKPAKDDPIIGSWELGVISKVTANRESNVLITLDHETFNNRIPVYIFKKNGVGDMQISNLNKQAFNFSYSDTTLSITYTVDTEKFIPEYQELTYVIEGDRLKISTPRFDIDEERIGQDFYYFSRKESTVTKKRSKIEW